MAIRIKKILDRNKNVINEYCEYGNKRCKNEKTTECYKCSVYSGEPGIDVVKFVAV